LDIQLLEASSLAIGSNSDIYRPIDSGTTATMRSPIVPLVILSVVLVALLPFPCRARELQGQKAVTKAQQGCNRLQVRAPNCPGQEICFFWKKAYSGCDNCGASFYDACHSMTSSYTTIGALVNVEEAVFYRFGARVVPGYPNQSYHLVLRYFCAPDGMLKATINC
jgi:hypothetical protein